MRLHLFLVLAATRSMLPEGSPLLNKALDKKYRLMLPAFIPFTGNDPFDGSICRAAMQVAVDAVNSQTKILPDYAIEPVYADEGPLSMKITEFLVKLSMARPPLQNSTTFRSPVALGAYFSPACKYIGAILHHVGMAFVGTGCGAPNLVDKRDKYPNLYRLRSPGLNTAYLRAVLIKQFTNWTTMAIITYSDNAFDLGNAILFHELAGKIGVKVAWFDAVPAITDEVVLSMKASKARIIVADLSAVSMSNTFLCLAYKHGMTGSRYVFIGSTSAFADPTDSLSGNLPPSCTSEILQKQYTIAIWLGNFLNAFENYGKTDFGYDLDEFERRLDGLTNSSRVPDRRSRHYCHDAMLESILALDSAERRLNARNLSLRSSSSEMAIMQAANESVAKIDYVSIRVGRSFYSNRLEMDYEPMFFGFWKNSPSRLQLIHTAYLTPNTSHADYRNYRLVEKERFIWTSTVDGKLPRDKAIEKAETLEVPLAIRITIYILTALIGSCHLFLTTRTVVGINAPGEFGGCNLVVLIGCFLLDASAIAFVTSSEMVGSLCLIRETLIVAGSSLLHGFAYVKSMQLYQFYTVSSRHRVTKVDGHTLRGTAGNSMAPAVSYHQRNKSENQLSVGTGVDQQATVMIRKSSPTPGSSYREIHTESSSSTSKLTFGYFLRGICFILLNAIILEGWIAFSEADHVYSSVTFDDAYDQEKDTIIHRSGKLCQSFYGIKWIFAILALHLIFVVIALKKTYALHGIRVAKEDDHVKSHMLLLGNQIILLVATVFILLLLSNPFSQLAVVSFASLLISASAGFFAKFKTIKSLICGSQPEIIRRPSSINL